MLPLPWYAEIHNAEKTNIVLKGDKDDQAHGLRNEIRALQASQLGLPTTSSSSAARDVELRLHDAVLASGKTRSGPDGMGSRPTSHNGTSTGACADVVHALFEYGNSN